MKNLPLEKIVFCALDLETTGTNPAFHRIIEVGAVRFTLEGETDRYSMLLNPGMPVSDDARNIHGITDEMVQNSPSFKDMAPDLKLFMKDSVMVVHNPDFDLSFLSFAFSQAGITPPLLRALDTVRLARKTFPHSPNHKLNTLCEYLDIPIEHHRALPDAIACGAVLRRVLNQLDPSGEWTWDDLIDYHGSPIKSRRKVRKYGSNNEFAPGQRFIIDYKDSEGILTTREVVAHEVFFYGRREYLKAFCTLRQEDRFFRTNRILSYSQV